MRLPPCHSRRELEPGTKVFFCAHPDMVAPDQLVTPAICKACHYRQMPPPEKFRDIFRPLALNREGPCFHLGEMKGLRDCPTCKGSVRLKVYQCHHPLHSDTTIRECKICLDYEPRLAKGSVKSWAVGVTTAPRPEPTIKRCLRSLVKAGWDMPRIFAEPGVQLTAEFGHLPMTTRQETSGAWPNWWLGLSELVLRQPEADAYLMVEDDVLFCRNLRSWLEQELWPADRVAVVSLFTPQIYAKEVRGWHITSAGAGLAGAQGLVFPNVAARMLLAHPWAVNHRRQGGSSGLKETDAVIGRWAQAVGLPVYHHSPSLTQHDGETSTLEHGELRCSNRYSRDFVGEEFDALFLLSQAIPLLEAAHGTNVFADSVETTLIVPYLPIPSGNDDSRAD